MLQRTPACSCREVADKEKKDKEEEGDKEEVEEEVEIAKSIST